MKTSYIILLAIFIILIAAATVIIPGLGGLWGAAAMVILLVFVPGAGLTLAIYRNEEIDAAQFVAMSLALTMVIIILGGLLLNTLSISMSAPVWLLYLSGITILSVVIGLARKQNPFVHVAQLSPRINWRQAGLMGLAAVIATSAFVIAYTSAIQPRSAYTQFWALPDDGIAKIGIHNAELRNVTYNVEIHIGGQRVISQDDISLTSGESWEQSFDLTGFGPDYDGPIEVYLYRTDNPGAVYRYLKFWL